MKKTMKLREFRPSTVKIRTGFELVGSGWGSSNVEVEACKIARFCEDNNNDTWDEFDLKDYLEFTGRKEGGGVKYTQRLGVVVDEGKVLICVKFITVLAATKGLNLYV